MDGDAVLQWTDDDFEAMATYRCQERAWHKAYREASPAQRWGIIREIYATMMPTILEASATRRRGMIHPYFVNWKFTPIEELAWFSIRGLGTPLYPQVPVDRFFLDFANPYYRVGLELDGAAYHNEAKDQERDAILIDAGWTVIRVTGKEVYATTRLRDDDDRMEEEDPAFWHTSHGIIKAIDRLYFYPDPERYRFVEEATIALEKHRSGAFLNYWQKKISS